MKGRVHQLLDTPIDSKSRNVRARSSEKLAAPGGGVGRCCQALLEASCQQVDLFPSHSVQYEIGVLSMKIQHIAFFPSNVAKARAAEYKAYGNCMGQSCHGIYF